MAVDNQTYLNYSMIALAGILVWISRQFFAFLISTARLSPYLGTWNDITPIFLGIILGVAAFYVARKNEVINRFGTEVVVELRKVTWPTRKEVTGATAAVLIMVFVCGLMLFIFDLVFSKMLLMVMGQ